MDTKEDPSNHWNLPVDMGTLSGRVSMLCLWVHMQKIRPLVSKHICGKDKIAVSRYPVPGLKTASKNHYLGSPGQTHAVIS